MHVMCAKIDAPRTRLRFLINFFLQIFELDSISSAIYAY